MTTFQWYTLFHLIGAFAMAGGAVATLTAAVTSREGAVGGPSARAQAWAVRMLVLPGAVLALIFGLLLVHEAGYEYGDGWVSAAFVLWIAIAAVGDGVVGRNARSNSPSRTRALYGSSALVVLTLVILILMVWRPGT